MYPTYQSAVLGALSDLYSKLITFLPNLLAAIIVLILGWLVGIFLGKLIQQALRSIKIDALANQLGLGRLSERSGRPLSIAALGGWLVKWFFFISSLIAAADILNLQEVTSFLYQEVLPYAGHVVVAMVILLLGILAANFIAGIVSSSVKAGGLHASAGLGALARWSVLIFSIIAALAQLQIATAFLQDLFRAVVAMLAIAGGIAFGLGGQSSAKRWVEEMENNLTKRG